MEDWTNLMKAAKTGDIEQILKYKEAQLKNQNGIGQTALMIAVKNKQFEAAKHLLDEQTTRDGKNNTALYYAVVYDFPEIISYLTREYGMTYQNSQTALMTAVSFGKVKAVEILSQFEMKMVDSEGNTALMWSTKCKKFDCAKLLHDECGLLNNEKPDFKYSTLNENIECAKLLLEESGMQNNDGSTALMFATESDCIEIVQLLLKQEIMMKDNNGKTALMRGLTWQRDSCYLLIVEEFFYDKIIMNQTNSRKYIINNLFVSFINQYTVLSEASNEDYMNSCIFEVTDMASNKIYDCKIAILASNDYKKRQICMHNIDMKIEHKNCIHIEDGFTIKLSDEYECICCVMEFGITLKKFFEDVPKRTEKNLIKLVLDVCEGLKFIHSKGIIHRDIKPDNILIIEKDGDWKAVITDQDSTALYNDYFKNDEYGYVGTQGFIAPEIVMGRNYDYHCDLFSLGRTIHSMLLQFEINSKILNECANLLLAKEPKRRSSLATILYLLYYVNNPKTNSVGITALMVAACEGNVEQVDALKEQFISQKGQQQYKEGYTALMYAVEQNHYECSKHLLGETTMKNNYGDTALIIAIRIKNMQMIEMLAPHEKEISNEFQFPIEYLCYYCDSFNLAEQLVVDAVLISDQFKYLITNTNVTFDLVDYHNSKKYLINGQYLHGVTSKSTYLSSSKKIDVNVFILKVNNESDQDCICKVTVFKGDKKVRSLSETEIASKIEHKNVVRQHGQFIYFDSEMYCYVFLILEKGKPIKEYFSDGITLFDYIKFAIELCEGIIYLHSEKIIHRDIKPDNIIIVYENSGWVTKIIDFDVSKKVENITDYQNEIVGTLGYMAPEVSKGCYNYKCDIYSFGVTLYEAMELLNSQNQEKFKNIFDVSKLIDKNVEARIELSQALQLLKYIQKAISE